MTTVLKHFSGIFNTTLITYDFFGSSSCSILTGQDLDGVLPPALAKLPYLKQVYEEISLFQLYSFSLYHKKAIKLLPNCTIPYF